MIFFLNFVFFLHWSSNVLYYTILRQTKLQTVQINFCRHLKKYYIQVYHIYNDFL